tara:strand:+ start:150 stop:2198 length:2049 start_codon:yes stop_codon:yes gene_type:complete
MNNPLNRSMFRQAGMSKQPMGILASSPELMTTAQKAMASGQPVTANNGRANFISTAPTVGFGSNNQPYIPLNQQSVDPRIRNKSGAPSSSLQNYINSMSNAIKTKEERVIQKDESPLSAFGDEGRSINNAQKGFPLSYLLKGKPGRQEEFDEAGDEARAYYEGKTKGMIPDNIYAEPFKKDDNKSSGIGGSDQINTSTKTALEKAVAKVTNESEYEQQVSEENAIAGTDVYGKETSATSQAQLVNEKGVIKSDARIVPELGGNDYGLGVKKKGDKNNLSSNVSSDNTSVNAGVIDLNKTIAGSTPGSSENINANKKINSLISKTIADNKINEATDLNIIAHGGADEETIKELSPKQKRELLEKQLDSYYGKNAKKMGLEDDLEGMNLIMLGLRIAAGESPNAMTNIAKGALTTMEDVAKQKKEKLQVLQDRENFIVKTLIGRDDKEIDQKNRLESKKIDQKHDVSMFKMQDSATTKKDIRNMNFQVLINDKNNLFKLGLKNVDLKMHGQKLKNSMNIAVMGVETQEKITLAGIKASQDALKFKTITQQEHAENMFKLNKELDLEKAMIGNMPKGYALGLMEGKKKGLTGEKLADFAATQGNKFAKSRTLTGSETLKGSLFGIVEAQVKDGISIDDALKNTLANKDFQMLHQKELTLLGLYNQPNAGNNVPGFKPNSLTVSNN